MGGLGDLWGASLCQNLSSMYFLSLVPSHLLLRFAPLVFPSRHPSRPGGQGGILVVAPVLTFLGSLTWKVDVSLVLIIAVKTRLLELLKKREGHKVDQEDSKRKRGETIIRAEPAGKATTHPKSSQAAPDNTGHGAACGARSALQRIPSLFCAALCSLHLLIPPPFVFCFRALSPVPVMMLFHTLLPPLVFALCMPPRQPPVLAMLLLLPSLVSHPLPSPPSPPPHPSLCLSSVHILSRRV